MRVVVVLAVAAGCASGTTEGMFIPDAPDVPDGAGQPDVLDVPDAGPPLYPDDRTQSPITAPIVQSLQAIAARATEQANVFAKVGDSITVGASFMGCFAGANVNLDGRTGLQPTIDWFLAGDAGGTNPYQRVSLAAKVGVSAPWALAGDPSPLEQEVAAIQPRHALVMYGTNDAAGGAIHTYADAMLTIVDELSTQGVVPILYSVPPNDAEPAADARVPRYNLVARGIAQGRRIPFIDYWRELVPLPNHGLAGDGVHPQSYGGGCVFTATGLLYGVNMRNLLSIEALERARAALAGQAADDDAPVLAGAGTVGRPFVIPALPFTDLRDTTRAPSDQIDVYGCAPQDESGGEVVYRLSLGAPATLRATVFVRGQVDVDIHLLDDSGCLARNDREILQALPAGTYTLVADTFVPADGMPRAGEYLLTVMVE